MSEFILFNQTLEEYNKIQNYNGENSEADLELKICIHENIID
jgi:hypothetical protein